MESLRRRGVESDPDRIKAYVADAYSKTSELLDNIQDPALLVDALCSDCPIVGVTAGFRQLTGYEVEHVIGKNCRMMLEGVPPAAISRSARKNIVSYCSTCQVEEIQAIPQITAMQPNVRRDGSYFVNFFMLGMLQVKQRVFILGVQRPMGEGLFAQMSQAETCRVTEASRGVFKRIRDLLSARELRSLGRCEFSASPRRVPRSLLMHPPEFAFYEERLQDHCYLVNHGYTAVRREPQELAFNCLVFGDRPVRHTADGLSFSIRVEEATSTFHGLPVLGFTRRRPTDSPDLYPSVARCMGSSVLVGACGEAFARDSPEHFRMGFRQPPPREVQTWSLQPDVPPHKRKPPVDVQPGDVLKCVYRSEGRLQLLRNDQIIIDFDVERPLQEDVDYFAVVDVCFAAYSVTVMPSQESTIADAVVEPNSEFPRRVSFSSEILCVETPHHQHDEGPQVSDEPHEFFSSQVTGSSIDSISFSSLSGNVSRQCTEIVDLHLPNVVNEVLVKRSIKEAVADCTFMVTIADPREKDCPLIAVSGEFEAMTGFQKSEILGVNCRFLNQGCDMDAADLAGLRLSSKTGAPFTAVIPNRKKSGELFLNLLDLRGLSVAQNPRTGEDLWFLIGIQADVTGLAEDEVPKDLLRDLQEVADGIRKGITRELSHMAVEGALTTEGELTQGAASSRWHLLERPCWRPGRNLGIQRTRSCLVAEPPSKAHAATGSCTHVFTAGKSPTVPRSASLRWRAAALAFAVSLLALGGSRLLINHRRMKV